MTHHDCLCNDLQHKFNISLMNVPEEDYEIECDLVGEFKMLDNGKLQ